jgi:chitinase
MPSKTISSTTAILSVYDGRFCVGFILARGRDGFEAFNADETSLGLFSTQDAAASAIAETTP